MTRYRFAAVFAALALSGLALPQAQVLTQHNDLQRTGVNSSETILNPTNVNAARFGKVCTYTVDGQIYGQPLIASVTFKNGTTKNVLFVTTAHNSVYAFDADAKQNGAAPIWTMNAGPSVPHGDVGSNDITPEIGIVGAPVIDPTSHTIYFIAKTKERGAYFNRLHALSVVDGTERPNSPVTIMGSVQGTGGTFAISQTIPFNPLIQMARPALTLLNGVVYAAFGSHGDNGPYHGWVFGYETANLARKSVWCDTPDDVMAGIWQAGNALAATTDGHLVFGTGNGGFSHNGGSDNVGNSYVKLAVTATGLHTTDWFTPYNSDYMNYYDLDLGCSGPVVINDYNVIVGGGKVNTLYEVSLSNMGHYDANADHVITEFPAYTGYMNGSPVYYRDPTVGPLVFTWGDYDVLKAWTFDANGVLLSSPLSSSSMSMGGYPGGSMAVSSNGHQPGSAVLWATGTSTGDGYSPASPGILRAFDVRNLSNELWDSEMNTSGADSVGYNAKFNSPAVANGRVYVATFSNAVVAYGLKN